MITAEQETEILQRAERLFSLGPDWAAFYREMMGLRGVVRQHFSTRDELAEFEQTAAYKQIQQMVTSLRENGPMTSAEEEPTKGITVRLPRSRHEGLRVEAHEHHTSMNKLCISKLLQFIDNGMIPSEP